MLLTIDIGNSRIKWRVWASGRPLQGGAEEHHGAIDGRLFDRLWQQLEAPEWVAVVNVAGDSAVHALELWVELRWGRRIYHVRSEAEACGVKNGYADPLRLGADRWAALVAAVAVAQGRSCLVVDCGTALTVDALLPGGEHLGGLITPGIELMHKALLRGTQGVRTRLDDWPAEQTLAEPFGKSTDEAVYLGARIAAVGLIEKARAKLSAMEAPVTCIITGGDAPGVRPLIEGECYYEPDLVLHGVARLVASKLDGNTI